MENSAPVSPKATRESVSPTTSTPGQHHVFSPLTDPVETLNSPARMRKSELSESDESTVMSSSGEETIDQTTVLYEKPEEDTTIVETTPNSSCAAYRTRSKSSSTFYLSELIGIGGFIGRAERICHALQVVVK